MIYPKSWPKRLVKLLGAKPFFRGERRFDEGRVTFCSVGSGFIVYNEAGALGRKGKE